MTLDLTEVALDDLRAIRDYTITTWGDEQEAKYLDGIWNMFETLLGDPERFHSRDDLFPGCRVAIHQKHAILFRVEGEVLQVARVLHGAMDFKRHLDEIGSA